MSGSPSDDAAPVRPDEPEPGDCCGGGCVSCVYDLYETALEKYERRLAAWRARHPGDAAGQG